MSDGQEQAAGDARTLRIAVLIVCAVMQLPAIAAQDTAISLDSALRYPDGSLQTTSESGVAPVVDSGQTACWDAAGASRLCSGTGEDGEHRAGLSFVSPRFTDHGDGTVTDHQTGLMWLKHRDCLADGLTWQEALDSVAAFNSTARTHRGSEPIPSTARRPASPRIRASIGISRRTSL